MPGLQTTSDPRRGLDIGRPVPAGQLPKSRGHHRTWQLSPIVSPLKRPQCFCLETSTCPLMARLLPLLPWDLQGEGGAVKVSGEHVLGRPRGASPGCRCWGRVCPGQSGWSPSALRGDRQLRSAVGNSSAFTRIRPLPESPHSRRCRGTRPPWPRGVLRPPWPPLGPASSRHVSDPRPAHPPLLPVALT